jgi:hypothetical protein
MQKGCRVTERLGAVEQGAFDQGDADQPDAGRRDAGRPVGEVAGSEPLDLSSLVPERLARAYGRRRSSWTTIDSVAAWLLGAHLLLLLVIVGRGGLFIDDLRAQGYALNQPFWRFILDSNGTHFAPLPRTLDWLQSRLAPLEHGPAVAVTLLVRLVLAVGFWRVLRRLFGPRPATLVPFTLLLATPALIPATTYYRQSITIVACTAAIIWALDAHLRWVIYRHRADLLVLVAATTIGLGCYEKAAAMPVILLVVTTAIFAGRTRSEPGTFRPGRPGTVRAGVLASAVSGVVVLAFLVIYRSGPYDQGGTGPPSVLEVLQLSWDVVTRSMIPLLLGGPFHWSYPSPYAGVPLVSRTAIALTLVIVLVGLVAALRRNPGRTGRGLAVLVTWLLPSVAIVAAGRFDQLGPALSTAVRLWSDLVPAFLLAAGLAVLPWRVGVHREPSLPAPNRTASPAESPAPTPGGAPLELTVPTLAAGLVLLLVLGGSVFSSLTYASKWWDNPTGRWIANARASLVNAEPYPRTLATPLPPDVMPSFVTQVFPTDAPLLLLLRPDLRFHDGDGDTKVMNAAGVRSAYVPNLLVETATKELCVAALPPGDAPVTMPLPKPVTYVPGAQLELGLLLAESTKVAVTVTTPQGQVLTPERYSDDELPQGPHTIRFPMPYLKSVRSISVRITATKTSCVAYARIWAPLS